MMVMVDSLKTTLNYNLLQYLVTKLLLSAFYCHNFKLKKI